MPVTRAEGKRLAMLIVRAAFPHPMSRAWPSLSHSTECNTSSRICACKSPPRRENRYRAYMKYPNATRNAAAPTITRGNTKERPSRRIASAPKACRVFSPRPNCRSLVDPFSIHPLCLRYNQKQCYEFLCHFAPIKTAKRRCNSLSVIVSLRSISYRIMAPKTGRLIHTTLCCILSCGSAHKVKLGCLQCPQVAKQVHDTDTADLRKELYVFCTRYDTTKRFDQ